MADMLVLLGAGGHAAVLAEAIDAAGGSVTGLAVVPGGVVHPNLAALPRFSEAELIQRHAPADVVLVNGVGSLPGSRGRAALFAEFRARGYRFATVVAPSALISPSARLEEGAQVMAGAIVQAGAAIGANAIVNTGAIIDHDTVVGADAHIAPGVTLSGGVIVEEGVHVGTGACVIHGIRLGEHCVVGAGASVVRDVAPRAILLPAKPAVRDEGNA